MPRQDLQGMIRRALAFTSARKTIRVLREQLLQQAAVIRTDETPASPSGSVQALRPLPESTSFSECARLIVDRWLSLNPSFRGGLFWVDEEHNEYRLTAGIQNSERIRNMRFSPNDKSVQRLSRAGIIRRIGRDPTTEIPADSLSEKLSAAVVVPLFAGGALKGWLFCSAPVTGAGTHLPQADTLAVFAQHAAQALSHAAAHPQPRSIDPAPADRTQSRSKTDTDANTDTDTPAPDEEGWWQDLANSMAHEVRNPLVAIKTFSQLLPERYEDEDFRAEFSRLVTDEVDRLNGMIDLLEQYAHPPAQDFRGVDVSRIIHQSVAQARQRLGEQFVEPALHMDEDLPPVQGDEPALVECVEHLLRNAVEAVRHVDQPAVSITCHACPAAGGVHDGICIRVSDNGPGIDDIVRKKIFSPFCTTKPRGLGLGMAVARRTIHRHEGRLHLQSSSNGTDVEVILKTKYRELQQHEAVTDCG
jgi:anti-sigma regulatory factor (Ser/Thr protein kinase)